MFPFVLDDDEFEPADHICRVLDAFVEKLMMSELACMLEANVNTSVPGDTSF
jgi:hypothetical protein